MEHEPFFFAGRLARFYRLTRRFRGMRGAAAIAISMLSVATLVIAIDIGGSLAPATRWGALIALLGGGGALLWRAVVLPLRRYDMRQALNAVERAHPALGQRLRTACQFADREAVRTAGVSQSLAAALIDDTRNRTQRIEPDALIPWRRVRALLAGAGGALVLWCVAAAVWQDFRTGVLRLFAPGSGWTFTRVTARSSAEAVPAGRPVTIEGLTAGRRPASALLHIGEDGDPWASISMAGGDGVFRATWTSRGGGCRYFVEAGDGRSALQSIAVLRPPAVEKVKVRLCFPAYTKLDAIEREGGDIEAVEGTEAHVIFVLNHAVTDARVCLAAGGSVASEIAGSEVRARLRIARGDTEYHLDARDAAGLEAPRVDYLLRGIEDKLPEIEILAPEPDIEVTKITEVPLRFRVRDDFGLGETGIVFTVRGKDERLLARTFAETIVRVSEEEAIAFLERYDLGMTDDVRYYVFAHDGMPGRAERAVSDLRSIDIRPFRLEYRLIEGGGG